MTTSIFFLSKSAFNLAIERKKAISQACFFKLIFWSLLQWQCPRNTQDASLPRLSSPWPSRNLGCHPKPLLPFSGQRFSSSISHPQQSRLQLKNRWRFLQNLRKRLGRSCTPEFFLPERSEERRVGKECRSRW